MRLSVAGKVYPLTTMDQVPLGDILRLQGELVDLGGVNGMTSWPQIRAMTARLAALGDKAPADPDFPFLTALMVWATRRRAGEKVTFMEAADVSFSDVQQLPDVEGPPEEDPQPGK